MIAAVEMIALTRLDCYGAESLCCRLTGTLSPGWFDLDSFSNLLALNLSHGGVRTHRYDDCSHSKLLQPLTETGALQLVGTLPAAWANQTAFILQSLDLSSNLLTGRYEFREIMLHGLIGSQETALCRKLASSLDIPGTRIDDTQSGEQQPNGEGCAVLAKRGPQSVHLV